jgi:hypothetical protein
MCSFMGQLSLMMQVWRTRNGYIIGTVQPDELVLLGSCFIGDGAIHNGNNDFTIDCDPPHPPPAHEWDSHLTSYQIHTLHSKNSVDDQIWQV